MNSTTSKFKHDPKFLDLLVDACDKLAYKNLTSTDCQFVSADLAGPGGDETYVVFLHPEDAPIDLCLLRGYAGGPTYVSDGAGGCVEVKHDACNQVAMSTGTVRERREFNQDNSKKARARLDAVSSSRSVREVTKAELKDMYPDPWAEENEKRRGFLKGTEWLPTDIEKMTRRDLRPFEINRIKPGGLPSALKGSNQNFDDPFKVVREAESAARKDMSAAISEVPTGKPAPTTFVLDGAKDIVYGARQTTYGHASESFERIAAGWELIVGVPVSKLQVGLMMDWLKTSRILAEDIAASEEGRAVKFEAVEDGFKDKAGYAEATMRAQFEDKYGHRPKR